MAITANNVIFIYRDGDADSLEVAEYYRDERGVPAAQIIAVPCSTHEILESYSDFVTEVEGPIQTALTTAPLNALNIYAIILGFNVPGGFYDGENVVSSVSRIMRIGHDYIYNERNHFYVQKVYNGLFVNADTDYAYIVSRIDGPTKEDAINIIDNNTEIIQQKVVNGYLYLDPYFGLYNNEYNSYKDKLITFAAKTVPEINIKMKMTELTDPYVDSVFGCLENDSFYWGGISDYAPEDFFYNTDTSRLFFFNIDNFSAVTIRDSSETYWVEKALSNSYCSAAGAMSTISTINFLDPKAFFLTLKSGTLGEAFLFSLPKFNCPMTFIGDPLTTIKYPPHSTQNENVPNIFSPFYGNIAAGPYAFQTRLFEIDITEDCWTDPIIGDIIRIDSINMDINGTHLIKINSNTFNTWKKVLPQAITFVKWFVPVANPADACNEYPSNLSEGETINFDIEIIHTITKPDSATGIYYLRTLVQSARKILSYETKSAGYIKLFDGGIYYNIKTKNIYDTANNSLEDYSIVDGSYVLGRNGTSRVIKELFINCQKSIV